jgi:hypothetical protein
MLPNRRQPPPDQTVGGADGGLVTGEKSVILILSFR